MRAQASIGTALLGMLAAADALVGGYVIIMDELVKDRRLVRTKPYQLDLDDALALTDEDALARDMFARPSPAGPSQYMQAGHLLIRLMRSQERQRKVHWRPVYWKSSYRNDLHTRRVCPRRLPQGTFASPTVLAACFLSKGLWDVEVAWMMCRRRRMCRCTT